MLVVTGASGFLGRTIVMRAAAHGLAVTAVSRKPAMVGDVPAVRLADYSELEPVSMNSTLIHLAEEADIGVAEPHGASHVARMRDTFASLAKKGWRHIVYASSGIVYGDHQTHARREDERIEPASFYARAKLACEQVALGAGGAALRLGNLYGPGMSRRVVISDIVAQLGQPEALRVRDASPVRDFVHVQDAADGFLSIAETGVKGVYNLATGHGISVGNLARLVLSIAGENGRSVLETDPSGRISHLALDVRRIRAAAGWQPAIPLEDGLQGLVHVIQ
jgi:UDP-glucose 4-epimerase